MQRPKAHGGGLFGVVREAEAVFRVQTQRQVGQVVLYVLLGGERSAAIDRPRLAAPLVGGPRSKQRGQHLHRKIGAEQSRQIEIREGGEC
jgi:hypothetical protein